MMGTNVMDFTDLGNGIPFSYKGQKFEVPSFTKNEMSILMKISEKMVEVSKELNKEDKDKVGSDEPVGSDKLKALFEAQQEFVIAGIRSVSNEGTLNTITMDTIDAWPWRLVNRVSSLVQEMMSNVSGMEKESVGAGKNPTK
jgi:hypothetical protein